MTIRMLRRYTLNPPKAQPLILPNCPNVRAGLGLDVTYGEDGLRTRQRTIAENLAWLRRFTLSLLKQHPGKVSLAMKRRICGWNDDFLMEVLGIKGT